MVAKRAARPTLQHDAFKLNRQNKPVYPELVEGLHFFLMLGVSARRKGQCFDELGTDGF